MSFGIGTIDMSMAETSGANVTERLKGYVYTLEGVQDADKKLRNLSIGQLVLAICLTRATALEENIVTKMESLAQTSAKLEALTAIDAQLVAQTATNAYSNFELKPQVTVNGTSYKLISDALGALDVSLTNVSTFADAISVVESKMDSLNSVSQTTLIDIQSLTAKRDDTYNLSTNVLKSLNTVIIGNINNF